MNTSVGRENASSADNQQERLQKQSYYFELKRLPREMLMHFLAGFVDGEGSFNVSFAPHPNQKLGWIVNPKFQVYQHEKHPEILEIFQEVFQEGRINKKSGSNVLVFTIHKRKTLVEKVIPFFERYPLATKREVFEKWKIVMLMLYHKEALTPEGFKKLVGIAHGMNIQGKGRKYSKEFIEQTLGSGESSETRRPTPLIGR